MVILLIGWRNGAEEKLITSRNDCLKYWLTDWHPTEAAAPYTRWIQVSSYVTKNTTMIPSLKLYNKLHTIILHNRPLSHGSHFSPKRLKKLCICTANPWKYKAFLISWDKMAAAWQRSIIAVYWFGVSSITLNWSATYHDRCWQNSKR